MFKKQIIVYFYVHWLSFFKVVWDIILYDYSIDGIAPLLCEQFLFYLSTPPVKPQVLPRRDQRSCFKAVETKFKHVEIGRLEKASGLERHESRMPKH